MPPRASVKSGAAPPFVGPLGCSRAGAQKPSRGSATTLPDIKQKAKGPTSKGGLKAKPCGRAVLKAKLDPQVAAAIKIQARFRGNLGRLLAARQRMRVEQQREEEEFERAQEKKRQADAAAKLEVEEAKKRQAEKAKEEKLRAFRDRRSAVEQMCQGLPSHTADWEEDPAQLLELLDNPKAIGIGSLADAWLGRHSTRRDARKAYLQLARKWHPDKWQIQGERCVEVATDVTKRLVEAFDKACKELPLDAATFCQEDEDEDKELWEFACWVGISFQGMEEVWKHRKGVKR
eukprot:TRINITY_DN105686_c0_g1_i1.p1 TRINITY_DN105686_c0_g1~~TRINITY_DN105686_c0_g1_i1.p1  ORF type:complete len:290 (-),score=79.68 TRINITY_DN105686_c0_g1_i1:46-915(-)